MDRLNHVIDGRKAGERTRMTFQDPLTSELARRHRERAAAWGRIVGLTSGGDFALPEEVSYGAAKAAQTNHTMSAAAVLADLGITTNLVHPRDGHRVGEYVNLRAPHRDGLKWTQGRGTRWGSPDPVDVPSPDESPVGSCGTRQPRHAAVERGPSNGSPYATVSELDE
jgi:hypothetical protein